MAEKKPLFLNDDGRAEVLKSPDFISASVLPDDAKRNFSYHRIDLDLAVLIPTGQTMFTRSVELIGELEVEGALEIL
jgi:hypothetical protein